MSIQSKLSSVRQEIENQPHDLRAAWCNVTGLRELVAERSQSLAAAFSRHPSPDPLSPNSKSHPFTAARDASQEYVALKLSLDLLETSEDFKQAEKVISPLVAEVLRLEAQLREDQHAAAQVIAARDQAIATAKAEAIAEIEERFAAEPAPAPFRGKVKLATA